MPTKLYLPACFLILAVSVLGVAQSEEKPAEDKPSEEGFVKLFDGKTLEGWQGATKEYVVEDGTLICKGGRLFTNKEYSDFVFRFEFKLPPGGNNGVALRAPLEGDPAYVAMESQILDDTAAEYANLQPYQYHGSIYGVFPSKKGHQKPVGEWNEEEITLKGSKVTVKLNGTVIVEGDLSKYYDTKTPDNAQHTGLKREKGYLGFLGHGSPVAFRNIRIKELK